MISFLFRLALQICLVNEDNKKQLWWRHKHNLLNRYLRIVLREKKQRSGFWEGLSFINRWFRHHTRGFWLFKLPLLVFWKFKYRRCKFLYITSFLPVFWRKNKQWAFFWHWLFVGMTVYRGSFRLIIISFSSSSWLLLIIFIFTGNWVPISSISLTFSRLSNI